MTFFILENWSVQVDKANPSQHFHTSIFLQVPKEEINVPSKEETAKQNNDMEKFEMRDQNKIKTEAKWKYKVLWMLEYW